MSDTPFSQSEILRIGTVDFVSPNEIRVLLGSESPESIALNAGGVRQFPRVNGYVLIPADESFLVSQIEWLTVERSAIPRGGASRDANVIDLPYPLRKLSSNPVGTLRRQPGVTDEFSFTRGVSALPSVGGAVLLPTDRQLRAIVESGDNRHVFIGTSPLAADAEVRVDPNRLFGRHLAVLGNTGSGKSCSVAGLIRWSLDAASRARSSGKPNARFIILDPNGEYAKAFPKGTNGPQARVYRVAADKDEDKLKVPLWFWNGGEWNSIAQASSRAQRPTLIQALRSVKTGDVGDGPSKSHELRRFLRTLVSVIRSEKNSGAPWGSFPKNKNFYMKVEKWKSTLETEVNSLEGSEKEQIESLMNLMEAYCVPRRAQYAQLDFSLQEVRDLLAATSAAHSAFGGLESDLESVDADIPRPFNGDALLRSIEATAEMMGTSDYVETLLIRVRSLLADNRIAEVTDDGEDLTLDGWLENYIGKDEAKNGEITVLDLSLVPSEIVHTITAVIARMVFEALQRYRKLNQSVLPTVLVMEEAHTFVKRYVSDGDSPNAAATCCQVFERIAREGRKFGLGLLLSSQRPSELSPTVLSQCNSFLLHRISNDRDQELVGRLVPDNLRGLLRELPTLPSQHAILLGWAAELPILTQIRDLPDSQRPHSDDPDFWEVWTGKDKDDKPVDRAINWHELAQDWQQL